MLNDLFLNAAILIAFISIGNQIFRDTNVNKKYLKFIAGIICGILCILLIRYSVDVGNGYILDYRYIALLIAGTLGGTISIVVSTIFIVVLRVINLGISLSSIVRILVAVVVGILFSFIFSLDIPMRKKWIYSTTTCLLITSAVFIYLLEPAYIKNTLFWNIFGTIVVTYFVYRYIEYLQETTSLFQQFKEESTKDYLTGVYNVRHFDRMINQFIEKASAKNYKLALLFIDIDHFKAVNDSYGYQEGEKVLKEVARLISQACREKDLVFRTGGEEFSVIMENCSENLVKELAESIRCNIERYGIKLSTGNYVFTTISIGVAIYPNLLSDTSNIIECTETALFEAKQGGRNKVVIYDQNFSYSKGNPEI